MTEVCDLHKLRDCKRCPERPENDSLTGSAMPDQGMPADYWALMSDQIWDGTGTNIKPCRPIPYGADE